MRVLARSGEAGRGMAVMVCKGYFRHGLSWYGGHCMAWRS